MALKKPSELFNDKPKKSVEIPEHLEGLLPENFDAYKSNLKNIEILNDFVSSFGTLKENIQKIDNLQEVIQSLKEDLKNSITKEDLDTAMMSNLLILEKNIQKIEFNLKGINRKDLNRIDEEIEDIENKVVYILEEEFPKYKKALTSNEIFIKDKFYEYSTEIDQKVNQFEEFITNSFEIIQENLQSINDSQLFDIRENVVKSSQEIESQNQLIEKSKKQIFGLEKDVQEFYERIQETFQSYQQSQEKKILTLEENITFFGEKEIQKYRGLLQETRIQNDEKIHSFEKNLTEKYNELSQSVSSLISSVENKSIIIEETSNIIEVIKESLKSIQSDYSKKDDQQKDIETLREHFTKKINLLENDISFKDGKIKKVNKELTETIENISNQFQDLNVDDLKKKYSHLTNKISYIEKVFDKFNEKTVLNEGLLNEPPTAKNTDPLTPLDKNFVTLDQLQQHYRLFINRIQQQLATIGGGGETRLEFLDDIDRSTAKINGRFLKYDAASDKWIGAVGGSQTLDDTLGIGNTSSIGMSVGVVTATSFVKSGGTSSQFLKADGSVDSNSYLTTTGSGSNLTGIVTSIVAGTNITVSGSTGQVTINSTATSGVSISTNTTNSNLLIPYATSFGSTTGLGATSLLVYNPSSGSVGIGTTNPTSKLSVVGDGNFTGVVTATTFIGNLTGTATSTTNIPNLTGAITSNNTTTSLGSFTSANLAAALTDETGSGAAVFATSPTLVTPILGAASATSIVVGSGVTINASGINASAGVVTATSFSGSGTNLTGIVTSIVAGTNVTISGSTGQVTINATGGGGSSGVVIQDQGSTVGTATTINFSTNLTASFSSGTATITATGGGGATAALDILEVMLFA